MVCGPLQSTQKACCSLGYVQVTMRRPPLGKGRLELTFLDLCCKQDNAGCCYLNVCVLRDGWYPS